MNDSGETRRVVSVVGARPQFIKAAVVSRKLRALPGISELLIHTGQHYDENMSRVFFRELGIPEPDYHLEVGSGPHGAQTGRMLERLEQVLMEIRPAAVLVYGDTNSTLAGALAAVKLHIPVVHVEAGLRSFNRRMPEEINRVVVDHIADLLFAPTDTAVERLLQEGVEARRIHRVGDVMFDAALYYGEKAERESDVLERLSLVSRRYVLVTVHRAENTDDPRRLGAIVEGLDRVARSRPVVWPLHPRTRRILAGAPSLREAGGRIRIVDPVGYLDMCRLEKHALAIATDSGGVQKEAFFYRVPCATLRDETEWEELVRMGWNRLLPPRSPEEIHRGILDLAPPPEPGADPYGGGRAAERVAFLIERWLRGDPMAEQDTG